MKTLGVVFAAAVCAALAVGPGVAQENAHAPNVPKAVSNRQSVRPGADGGVVHNAVGIAVPGGGKGSDSHVPDLATHAGSGVSGSGAGVSATGIVGTAGAGNVGRLDIHRPTAPLNTVAGPATPMTGINGTTIGHIASGPASIGGPAKDRSGINGTAMRPKH